MRRTHILLLAAFVCVVAVSLAVYWGRSDAPTRLDSLVSAVRAQRSEQETMGALVGILRWYEKKGQMDRITVRNTPERLGMQLTKTHEVPWIPLPWFDGEPAYKVFAIDFREMRRSLRLSFDVVEGKLREWRLEELPESHTQTLY